MDDANVCEVTELVDVGVAASAGAVGCVITVVVCVDLCGGEIDGVGVLVESVSTDLVVCVVNVIGVCVCVVTDPLCVSVVLL